MTEVRPKQHWFAIGGLLIVVAIVGTIVWVVLGLQRLDDQVDGFTRVTEGESITASFDDGGYVVYAEGSGSTALEVVAADGTGIDLDFYSIDFTYNFNGRSGRADWSFDLDRAGQLTVTNTGTSDVAIGRSMAPTLLVTVLGGFGFGAVVGLTGLIIIVVTAIRRGRSKRRQQPQFPPGGYQAHPAPHAPVPPAPAPTHTPPPAPPARPTPPSDLPPPPPAG